MFNHLQIRESKLPVSDMITKERVKLEVPEDKKNSKYQTIISKNNNHEAANKGAHNVEIPFYKKNLTEDEVKQECLNLLKYCAENDLLPDSDSFLHVVMIDNNGDKHHGFALLNVEEIPKKNKVR